MEKSVRKQKHKTKNYKLPRKYAWQQTKVKPWLCNQTCTTTKGQKKDDQRETKERRKLKKEEINDDTKVEQGFLDGTWEEACCRYTTTWPKKVGQQDTWENQQRKKWRGKKTKKSGKVPGVNISSMGGHRKTLHWPANCRSQIEAKATDRRSLKLVYFG